MRTLKASLLATAAAAATTLCLLGASPANAAPMGEQPSAASSADDPFARFALNAAQAKTLQAQIDKQIAAVGGKQISLNEIAYDGGATIMTFSIPGRPGSPASSKAAAPMADGNTKGCPYGDVKKWTCLYEFPSWNENSNGRRLQFSACGGANLRTYDFENAASSWVNNTKYKVHVSNFNNSSQLVLLWAEPSGISLSSSVGANDNKADYLDIRC
jgi:hypothetical protein